MPSWLQPPPDLQAPGPATPRRSGLTDRYREALEAQEQLLRQWQGSP
ncbi:MAG: hypothetical protein ACK6BG_06860 [Cyanobacteriota bacterium]